MCSYRSCINFGASVLCVTGDLLPRHMEIFSNNSFFKGLTVPEPDKFVSIHYTLLWSKDVSVQRVKLLVHSSLHSLSRVWKWYEHEQFHIVILSCVMFVSGRLACYDDFAWDDDFACVCPLNGGNGWMSGREFSTLLFLPPIRNVERSYCRPWKFPC